ncbi:hypothetical protein TNCV_5033611 [Trichonephila clavipes]|nr:hypothetical protein TNCV_5033611 [Trichonephila clavipes]
MVVPYVVDNGKTLQRAKTKKKGKELRGNPFRTKTEEGVCSGNSEGGGKSSNLKCLGHRGLKMAVYCSQLASLDKNNALWEIKLRLSYLQGKSTTTSVIAHQTEKEWISANEKSRQRMSQTQAEGAAKQHAARL